MSKIVWVPEDCIFESAGECLDKFPEYGAAAMLYTEQEITDLKSKIDRAADLLQVIKGENSLHSYYENKIDAFIKELESEDR